MALGNSGLRTAQCMERRKKGRKRGYTEKLVYCALSPWYGGIMRQGDGGLEDKKDPKLKRRSITLGQELGRHEADCLPQQFVLFFFFSFVEVEVSNF